MVKSILNLIRWKNVGITILTVFLMKYFVFETAINKYFSASTSQINIWETLLLSLSIGFIAAAGYIINDINDQKADAINKPDKTIVGNTISEKLANNLYLLFNFLGILTAFMLANHLGNIQLGLVHVFSAALLWIYSSYLKNTFFLGNFLVAIAAGLVPAVFFLFESYAYVKVYKPILLETYHTINGGPIAVLFNYTIVLIAYSFTLTLLREIVKDLQDEKGDFAIGAKTMPIVLGTAVSKKIVQILTLLTVATSLYFLHFKLTFTPFNSIFFFAYVYLLIIIPLLTLLWNVQTAKSYNDFQKPSNILKLVMLSGLLTTIIYATNA